MLALALVPAAVEAVPPSVAEVRAQSRAAGNDRSDALQIARRLLAQTQPAQVLQVRVDAVGPHRVAGVVVSGVKFHRRLDVRDFENEIAFLVRGALDAAPVEEVDVWATVPLDAGAGTVVSGDLAKPTSRIVFSITVPRADRAAVRARLTDGDDIYWDRAFLVGLERGVR